MVHREPSLTRSRATLPSSSLPFYPDQSPSQTDLYTVVTATQLESAQCTKWLTTFSNNGNHPRASQTSTYSHGSSRGCCWRDDSSHAVTATMGATATMVTSAAAAVVGAPSTVIMRENGKEEHRKRKRKKKSLIKTQLSRSFALRSLPIALPIADDQPCA